MRCARETNCDIPAVRRARRRGALLGIRPRSRRSASQQRARRLALTQSTLGSAGTAIQYDDSTPHLVTDAVEYAEWIRPRRRTGVTIGNVVASCVRAEDQLLYAIDVDGAGDLRVITVDVQSGVRAMARVADDDHTGLDLFERDASPHGEHRARFRIGPLPDGRLAVVRGAEPDGIWRAVLFRVNGRVLTPTATASGLGHLVGDAYANDIGLSLGVQRDDGPARVVGLRHVDFRPVRTEHDEHDER